LNRRPVGMAGHGLSSSGARLGGGREEAGGSRGTPPGPPFLLPPSSLASGLERLEFAADLLVAFVGLAPGAGLVQGEGLLPRLERLGPRAQPETDVAEVVPDHRVLGAAGQGAGPLQLLAGLGQFAAPEQHPAEAVDVGGVVLVAVGPGGGAAAALAAVQ